MNGKHVAEDTRCDAMCVGMIAEKWGYLLGSRCTHDKGHPTPRNGVGHYFPKAPKLHGYSAVNSGGPSGSPPKNPASSSPRRESGAA